MCGHVYLKYIFLCTYYKQYVYSVTIVCLPENNFIFLISKKSPFPPKFPSILKYGLTDHHTIKCPTYVTLDVCMGLSHGRQPLMTPKQRKIRQKPLVMFQTK